jgi:hypothetical protein
MDGQNYCPNLQLTRLFFLVGPFTAWACESFRKVRRNPLWGGYQLRLSPLISLDNT